ncbi:MAG: hypothetical protein AB7G15_11270 [Alphaproteobacteria bacterium]
MFRLFRVFVIGLCAGLIGPFGGNDINAFAQGTRAELDQVTAELQKKPADAALRERVIKIALALNPPPSVSEEARRFWVRGNTFVQNAKGAQDYDLAVQQYAQALRLAPWLGDAYFNQSKAYELRGQFTEAIAALRWYLLAAPGAADTRAAQDKIYELEAKAEAAKRVPPPASRPATQAQTKPAVPSRPNVTIEGEWRSTKPFGSLDEPATEWLTIRWNGTGYSITSRMEPRGYGSRIFSVASANHTMVVARHNMGFIPAPFNESRHQVCTFRLTNGGQNLEESCLQYGNETIFRLTNAGQVYARTR